MKLTLEIFQEPETPNQWTARCEELDIISANTSPEIAIEAVAEAVRMNLVYEMKRDGVSCVEAFAAIKARATLRAAIKARATLRRESGDTPCKPEGDLA